VLQELLGLSSAALHLGLGEHSRVTVPAHLAYGEEGTQPQPACASSAVVPECGLQS
jgi:FKBP-type peptidyl-prolyl cis-trans isomerase